MAKRHVVEFEDSLVYAQGGINLYRKGIDKFYLSHGLPSVHRSLEAARQDLERLGMFERCRDALVQAEELVRKGPEHDYDADTLILEANRALMQVSGRHDAMRGMYRAANDAPKSQGGEGLL